MTGREEPACPVPCAGTAVTGLTSARAERLLDWLENRGLPAPAVEIDERGVTLRFAAPPARCE
jgi:hypothetical protein